jgi:hypothetical protein
MTEDAPQPFAFRTFGQLLQAVENGQLHGDLSTELQDLCAELQDAAGGGGTATKGSVSLTLAFKFDPKTGFFEVAGDYKVTKPKTTRGRSIMWATADNYFTIDNPRQQQLFPRDVNETSRPIRSV